MCIPVTQSRLKTVANPINLGLVPRVPFIKGSRRTASYLVLISTSYTNNTITAYFYFELTNFQHHHINRNGGTRSFSHRNMVPPLSSNTASSIFEIKFVLRNETSQPVFSPQPINITSHLIIPPISTSNFNPLLDPCKKNP